MSLCHTVIRAPIHRREVHFGIKSVAEVMAERRNVVQENAQVEVLPVVDLCKKSAK